MAKELVFSLGATDYAAAPVKLERKKLYGWTEVRATDPSGSICQLVSLDEEGTMIIPKGSTKLGTLNAAGIWMEKDQLVAVDAAGVPLPAQPSSFDAPIKLGATVTTEQFLDHLITSVYQLGGEGCVALAKEIGETIYSFPFSYRGGFELAPGFLLANGETLYLFAGERVELPFVGLEQQGVIDEAEEDAAESGDYELDFNMM